MQRQQLITEKQLDNFKHNQMYGLFSEPGAGKTYAFTNTISEWAANNNKRVLYLSHRNSLKKQTKIEMREFNRQLEQQFKGDILTYLNYQAIEFASKEQQQVNNQYDLIIADEAHYLFADSWNGQTDASIRFLENVEAPVLLMSGTPNLLLNYFNNIQILKMPDYTKTNVVEIKLYKNEEVLLEEINKKKGNDYKVLIFVKDWAKKVQQRAEENNGSFVCSAHGKEYDKADQQVIEAIHHNYKELPSNLIFSTSILQEGINVKDKNFSCVASISPMRMDDIVQQVARVRDNKITVCLVEPKINQYQSFILNSKRELEEREVSAARKHFLMTSIQEAKEIIYKESFETKIRKCFPTANITYSEKDIQLDKLKNLLKQLTDVKLYKEDYEGITVTQETLKEKLSIEFGVRGAGGRKNISKKVISNWIKQQDLGYELISSRDRKINETYWQIKKVAQ